MTSFREMTWAMLQGHFEELHRSRLSSSSRMPVGVLYGKAYFQGSEELLSIG